MKIKTSFSSIVDSKFDEFGRNILKALTDHPFFTDLPRPLTELEALVDDYNDKLLLAKNRGKMEIVMKNDARKELERILGDYAFYVMLKARNNEQQLVSSGFELVKEKTQIGPLPRPENLKVKNGVSSGSLDVSVKAINGANVYIYEYKANPEDENSQWVSITHTSSKLTIYNLKPATRYAIRVAGKGASKTLVYTADYAIFVA